MSDPTPRGGASAPPRFGSPSASLWLGRPGTPTPLAYFLDRAREGGAPQALQAARARGRRIIGVFCSFIAEELLLALNVVRVRLCAGLTGRPPADLPRDTCPVVRGALARLELPPLAGLLDGVVVPTTCDWKVQTVRRLMTHLPVWEVEVPRAPEPEALAAELRRLASDLGELTDFTLTARSLAEAIASVNRARVAHRRLEALRRRPRPPLSGCEAMLIADTYAYGDLPGWTEACEALVGELEQIAPSSPPRPRLLLAGSPMIWPNFKVPELVEETGGLIVGDDFCSRASRLEAPDVQPAPLRDMLRALAVRALEPCTCGVLGQRNERERVVAQARALDADGVVCHYLRGCAPVAANQAALLRALREAGVPALTIETDAGEGDVERLRTRIEAFIELLNTRGRFDA